MGRQMIKSTLDGPLEQKQGANRCHKLVTLVLFLTDIADFFSDWLFFTDVCLAKQGLVYGPVSDAELYSLLVFSIVGTFTFLAEMVNLWWETFRNNSWVDSDLLSAVVIWIEDVPQVIINLSIALCREEPISLFQLTKAAVIILGVFIRLIITGVKYCNKEAVRSHHHVKYKALIFLGIIIEAACAGGIFFLTQTERDNDSQVSFRVPTTVLEERFNDQHYFANVSVFFHHAELFDLGSHASTNPAMVVNWARLASVNRIRDSDSDRISFSIDYQQVGAGLVKLAVWEKDEPGPPATWAFRECYEMDKTTAVITEKTKAECTQAGYFNNPNSLFLAFEFLKPGTFFRERVFGDIHFNMKMKDANGQCVGVTNYTDTVEDSMTRNIPITLHYYRTARDMAPQDIKLLLHGAVGTAPRFFRNTDSELVDVTKVWKTGWTNCDSTGSLSPNFDSHIPLDCSR